MGHLSLSLLGPLQFTLAGQPVKGFAYNKARALLAYLAVEADRPHQRDMLVGLLWPDLPERAARTNLRQTLANLREAIDDEHTQPPFLLISRDSVQFNTASDHALDVAVLTAGLAACDRHAHRHAERCRGCAEQRERALAQYRGDLLAQFSLADSAPFEEWALLRREWLHQRAIDALRRLATYYLWHGDATAAQRVVARQIALDPWREEAHRQLMQLLAGSGQRTAALAQYEVCRGVLAEALGIEPAPETVQLYEAIRAGAAPPALTNLSAVATTLPASPTPLVGRERELAELAQRLADPACRLITLVGPGGIGKTRLALAAAAGEAEAFEHGAAFVSLAALDSADLLVPTILSTLAVAPQPQPQLAQQLIAHLRRQELLLVLDNFEHLLASASFLAELLQQAPRVTLLVTSRERLALQSEWVFDLEGLSYPHGKVGPEAAQTAAVQLFVQRAAQAQRQFTLMPGDLAPVARLCQLVEGLPLAIELAAAAVRQQSCAELVAGIEAGTRALASSWRDVPERHQSLWAAFEQSWRLLPAAEQRAFSHLAGFRGGFEAAAAEQVTGASPAVLAALVDKSLLRLDVATTAAGGRPRRYEMHPLVRQYASDKLAERGETDGCRQLHLGYFAALSDEAEPHLYAAEQPAWLQRLEREHDNLRAALACALETGQSETAARLITGALWRFWYLRGHVTEARRWLAQLLVEPRASRIPVLLRTKAFSAAGVFAYRQGDYAEAQGFYETSLALRRAAGDTSGIASSLNNLGMLAQFRGNLAQAAEQFEECLALWRAEGNPRNISIAVQNLGLNKVLEGDYERATALLDESLALRQARGDTWGVAAALSGLADVHYHLGRYEAARTIYLQGLELVRDLGDRRFAAGTLRSLADIDRKTGHVAQARAGYRQAVVHWQALGERREIAATLTGLAATDLLEGQAARGARWLGAAEALLDATGAVLWPAELLVYEHTAAVLATTLAPETLAAAWTSGRALAAEEDLAAVVERES